MDLFGLMGKRVLSCVRRPKDKFFIKLEDVVFKWLENNIIGTNFEPMQVFSCYRFISFVTKKIMAGNFNPRIRT